MTEERSSGTTGTAPTLAGDPITLVGLLFESAIGLRHQLAPTLEGDQGVSGLAFEVLLRLYRSPNTTLRMSDLAAQTGLSRSGLTRAVDRLVEAGLCARSECEDDRRGTFALLTEGGRTYASGAIERHEQEIHNLLGGVLSSTEEEMLVTLLHRIRDQVNPAAAQLVLPSKIEELPPATTR